MDVLEHEREMMRREAERVIGDHPNVFNDAHMMAVTVCTLLDKIEAGEQSPGVQIWTKSDHGEVWVHELRPREPETVFDSYCDGAYLGPTTEAGMVRAGFVRSETPEPTDRELGAAITDPGEDDRREF